MDYVVMEVLHLNQTFDSSHTSFFLFGFPEITESRALLIIPFLSVYVAILSGNCLLIYRIWVEKTLQSMMYTLISFLFVVNLSCTNTILPPFLVSLVLTKYQISLEGCLVQMFFIYLTVVMESAVVLLMAFDRHMAICRPLRYHEIMTNRLLGQLSLLCVIRSVVLVCPIVISVSKVQFCGSNIIEGFACENMVLLKLGCGHISKMHITGLVVRVFVSVLDWSLILISYLDILRTTMKTVKGQAIRKALNTCSTHLIVAILIYTCGFLSSIVYRMGTAVPANGQNLVSAIYFLFPATVNPIIYGLRMKEIRICLVRAYERRKFHVNRPTRPNPTNLIQSAESVLGQRKMN